MEVQSWLSDAKQRVIKTNKLIEIFVWLLKNILLIKNLKIKW